MSDIMPPPPPKRVLPDRPVGWELLLFILVLVLIVVIAMAILAAIGDVAFGPQTGEALRRGVPEPGNTAHAWIYLGAFAVFYLAVMAATWIAMLLPFLRDVMAVGADELLITQVVRALTATPALIVGALLVLGVLGPVVEELVFRGLLYGWLRGFLPFALVAILTSALFGLVHGEWAHVIVAGILGLALAFIRERSGSLWPAIVAHAVNNLVAVGAAALLGV
jgi:membrane protease YdiL (CAAX protease family)